MVAGLYLGFDNPAPLGRGATGGSLAVPIFNDFMTEAVKGTRPSKFVVPEGMSMVAVNRKTGMAAQEGEPDTIIEAFKPGTGPADTFSVIGGLFSPLPPSRHPRRLYISRVHPYLTPPFLSVHKKQDHAQRNREHCRRNQAGHKPAEEASLTGIRR